MVVDLKKLEEIFKACQLVNKERSAHPYQVKVLKEKYPKIVTELSTVLVPIIEAIDEIIQHKEEYSSEIGRVAPWRRKKLKEMLAFLTDRRNADAYINLHNELI